MRWWTRAVARAQAAPRPRPGRAAPALPARVPAPAPAAVLAVRAVHASALGTDDASEAVQRLVSERRVEDAWRVFLDHGRVTPAAAHALLAALRTRPEATQLVRTVGVDTLDTHALTTYVQSHVKGGACPAEVHRAAQALRARASASPDVVAWHALFLYEAHVRGAHAALALAAHACQHTPFRPDSYTATTLAHAFDVATCDDGLYMLQKIEQSIGVRPGAHALTLAIKSVLRHGAPGDLPTLAEAMALYTEACAAYAVDVDAALLQPLIDAHCAAFVPLVDQPWAMLKQFLRGTRAALPLRRRKAQAPAPAAPRRVDLGLFYPLVRACARLHDIPTALDILSHMHTHRVHVPAHASLALARHLLSVCTSWDDAADVYYATHALGGWSSDTYTRLLAFVCKHTLGDARAPPALALQILGDMRHAGFHPSAQTYTTLLDFYAKAHATLAGVRLTHELIQRDVQLEPDLILIHALMNAYNYAGDPAQVLGIWDSLVVLSHNAGHAAAFINDITLTILCDTCGRAGLLDTARRVLATARAIDAALLTKDVHDAWIECLARCGHLREACDVVLHTMLPDPALAPDTKTVHTLLKFARNDAVHGPHVSRALHDTLPALCVMR